MSKTIDAITNKVINKASSGFERSVNESLFFGMGIYAWSDDVLASGIDYLKSDNKLFLHIKYENIKSFLSYLLNRDGYLSID